MKVKVKQISNAPQLYGYTAYVPKPNIPFIPCARVCAPDADFMEVYHNRECVFKSNYLFLAEGSLYGKRGDVLNHISKLHMLPPGCVISLISHTSEESRDWIITANPAGYLRIPRFRED